MYTIPPKKMVTINILNILRKYSDVEHRMTQQEIAEKLKSDYNMEVDRKTVKRNLMNLVEIEPRIDYTEVSRRDEKGRETSICTDWYIEPDFSDSELRLLIDSILFSKHIPYSQCKELIQKLEGLSNIYFKSKVKHISNLPENMPVYASVYPKFHREAWYREDFWNHEDFKTYAELANPDEIQDYYTSLADRGGYTKYYYIIDRILIEHVGVDAFNAWLDSVGDKDQNIVKFIEYFEITREVYNSLCANHNITPYNPDYLFGTPEMQDEYFKVHPLDLDHLHRAI